MSAQAVNTTIGDQLGVLGVTIKAGSTRHAWGVEVQNDYLDAPGRIQSQLAVGTEATLFPRLSWHIDALRSLQQVTPTTVRLRLLFNGRPVDEVTIHMRLQDVGDAPYAVDTERGPKHQPWIFASFVDESHPVIDTILREALNSGIVNQFAGYQGGHDAVQREVFAIWHALQMRGFRYSNITTPSAPTNGVYAQHIRSISSAIATAQANCVDGTVLFASILRRIGIDPVLVLVPGHMYLGYRLGRGTMATGFLETTHMGKSSLADLPREGTISGALAQLVNMNTQTRESARSFDQAYRHATDAFLNNQQNFGRPGYELIDVRQIREETGLLPVGRRGGAQVFPVRTAIRTEPIGDPSIAVQDGLVLSSPAPTPQIAAQLEGGSGDVWRDDALRIPNLGWRSMVLTVPSANCRLNGTIEGIAGGNADTEVRIASESDYQAWGENDLTMPKAMRSFERARTAEVDVAFVIPGRYWVVISNQFSLLKSKTVKTDLTLVCGTGANATEP
jgi:hypothetical protein